MLGKETGKRANFFKDITGLANNFLLFHLICDLHIERYEYYFKIHTQVNSHSFNQKNLTFC